MMVNGYFKNKVEEHLGGSVVERLLSAQVFTPGSWDRVPHQAPHREPTSPSAYVSASLCAVSYTHLTLPTTPYV